MIKTIGVILAGGTGIRFGSSIPKQFAKLNGKPVILYVLEEFKKSNLFDKIIIALPSKKFAYLFKEDEILILGGKTRNETIYNCLQIAKKYDPKYILFHDAARPLIKAEDLKQYIDKFQTTSAIITTEKITDSLYPAHVIREDYQLVQTPEAFRFDYLMKHFRPEANNYTAIYHHLPASTFIEQIQLNHPNYKITYPYDLFMLEHLVKYCSYEKQIPNLKNKTVLLLGASGGIGSAVYKELKKYNPKKIYIPSHKKLNVEWEFLSYLMSVAYKDVNIIINCCGIISKDNDILLQYNYGRIMKINLKTNLALIDYAKTLKNKPINIITISSSAATKGRPHLTNYSASKVALHSVIESQAEKLAEQEIYLNCICPEKVNTSLLKAHEIYIDKQEILEPEEVAKAILSYCDTKKYGQIIHIRKGYYEK